MKLVIVGAGETALLAYEYFTHDSAYQVGGFAVEDQYAREKSLAGLPVVPLSEIRETFPPDSHSAFVAISYTGLNRPRTRLYQTCKSLGYSIASYISSKAFVWHNVKIGENCFILENNVLQFSVSIGNNVTLWSGNHVGHQSTIHDNVFVSSHVVISGYCTVQENSFIGVNACLNDGITLATDCLIGSGSVVTRSTEAGGIYQGNPAMRRKNLTSFQMFKISSDS